ncbi:MAG: hypothetical protein GX574_02875, partial [Lentisphaerae bacterium]|nr:hypothetical protein [Lentisphaerota bacterium]
MSITRADLEQQLNRLYYATGANGFFEPPTLKIAAADDPLFARFKTIIGDFHWTPAEALAMKFPAATARSVIVWCMPKTEQARSSNRVETARPSLDWARARSFGEVANENMRRQLCRYLEEKGFAATPPHLNSDYRQAVQRLAGNWSERHVAFVAGMGTFGLSAGLITERGVAHRLASVVTDLELAPDVRPYGDDPFAWCTKCGACRERCPAHAIGPDFKDRDKAKCLEYAFKHITANRLNDYGWM